MSNTNSTAATKKNANSKRSAVNAPQIVESQNASDDTPRTASRARSGKAAIHDGIAPARIAAEADRLNYCAVIRRLIASNAEDMREDAEIREDFTRDGQLVPEARKQIGALLWRRMHLLAALEHCPPWCLCATLLALRVPLTEEEKALFSFLSALWPEDEQ